MAKIALVEDAGDTGSSDLAPAQRKTAEAPASPTPAAPPVHEPAPTPAAQQPLAPAEKPPAKGGRRRVILGAVALIAILAGSYYGHEWWTTGRFMISTDDAYVGADSSVVAPRIAGYVANVTAVDNASVKVGDPLVYLDDSDQKVAITAAENQIASQQASLDRIDKQIAAAKTAVDQAKASITSAEADRELSIADFNRATQLNASQFASKQSVDQAKATNDKAAAAVESAKAGLASAEANVAVLVAQRVEAERQLDQYRTTLDQRKLDLDRTIVRAPFDGVVGNRAVQPGEYVAAGQRLLALVPLTEVYIDANFKETQLAGIRPGAVAHVTVDAADGEGFEGKVVSVAPASGSVFSLLPPDNATGNFTKITQRVPVRIAVPASVIAGGALRPGLSVTVEIDKRTGQGAVAN
ncbi:membrane fusion protein, multidrug efflux system [Kaistia soli DSM 19436]|uniref:Membrane fusion protein, multidrug efflux system n=1 Tax=Kaistia soli DSM 19436 TaxID=1122133 RepID=A0A1M4W710_9HYPH|nr:HlyD family secretion protein [Kaistia soli]SHE76883.1 membrane fusion protein, multidrug efflux system [Kaistia soli DSM 19436]